MTMFNKKILKLFLTFFTIITLNFSLPRLMPGDPFYFLSGEQGEITVSYSDEEIQRQKAYYGLDKPVLVQYGRYLVNLARGDLGYSIYFSNDVWTIIKNRIPWSVSLVLLSVIIGGFAGTILGCLSAWHRKGPIDNILYSTMVFVSEIPPFLIGILFLFYLAAQQGLFPLSGGMTPFADYATASGAMPFMGSSLPSLSGATPLPTPATVPATWVPCPPMSGLASMGSGSLSASRSRKGLSHWGTCHARPGFRVCSRYRCR